VRDVFHYLSAGVTVTLLWRSQNQGQVAVAQSERTGAMARLGGVVLGLVLVFVARLLRPELALVSVTYGIFSA
jgi:hypothetical protein